MGCDMAECKAANSVITHVPTAAQPLMAKWLPPRRNQFRRNILNLKIPKTGSSLVKPVKRLDTDDKLNGKQIFGADLTLPGMLNASIKACPVFGGKLKSFDDSKVRAMPGVHKVVAVDDDAVAVVADSWWQAKTRVGCSYPLPGMKGPNANVSTASIDKMLDEGLTSKDKVFVGNKNGDVNKALKGAKKSG